MSRPRIVIAGLGDTGVLTAVRLAKRYDVVGISPKPALVSGQELGLRLTRPRRWARDYQLGFESLRGLDRVRRVHGVLEGLDPQARRVSVRLADGSVTQEPYDVLVIATGVRNGFWRRPDLQTREEVDASVLSAHETIAAAGSLAVIGGGAAAVSAAWNASRTWPDKRVDLFFPGPTALPSHHRRVWARLRTELEAQGVGLHPGHRAEVREGFDCDQITSGTVAWSTGQADTHHDAVLWAIGRAIPNSQWLPPELLDPQGFVRCGLDLTVPGFDGVFAIGDVAATDPQRSSARNFTFKLLARNIRAHLEGRPLKSFDPPKRRWGSVVGPQDDGLVVFTAAGQRIRIPRLPAEHFIQGWVVDRTYYRGIRRPKRDAD
ncbi:FAD-dependent oxidoreductase [Nocardioides sp.]|uniref:FAD-dependent oxidoreductase n=1 Tax=Nocardioides sp. TaxID=35761 RepID=UPI00356446DF